MISSLDLVSNEREEDLTDRQESPVTVVIFPDLNGEDNFGRERLNSTST